MVFSAYYLCTHTTVISHSHQSKRWFVTKSSCDCEFFVRGNILPGGLVRRHWRTLKNAYLGPRVMLKGAFIEGTLGLEWAG